MNLFTDASPATVDPPSISQALAEVRAGEGRNEMGEGRGAIGERYGIRWPAKVGRPGSLETRSQIPIEGVVFGLSLLSIVALIVAPHQIGAF